MAILPDGSRSLAHVTFPHRTFGQVTIGLVTIPHGVFGHQDYWAAGLLGIVYKWAVGKLGKSDIWA